MCHNDLRSIVHLVPVYSQVMFLQSNANDGVYFFFIRALCWHPVWRMEDQFLSSYISKMQRNYLQVYFRGCKLDWISWGECNIDNWNLLMIYYRLLRCMSLISILHSQDILVLLACHLLETTMFQPFNNLCIQKIGQTKNVQILKFAFISNKTQCLNIMFSTDVWKSVITYIHKECNGR